MPRRNVKQTQQDKQRQIVRLVIELDRELDGVRVPASAAAIVNALRELVR